MAMINLSSAITSCAIPSSWTNNTTIHSPRCIAPLALPNTQVAPHLLKKKKNEKPGKSSFEEPSVSWEEVQDYKHQILGREEVLAFLREEGIEPGEIEDVELFTTIDVLKERIDFLLELGLQIEDINAYPLMICCSVKKNMIPVLSYLEQLGVTPQGLLTLIRKFPSVLRCSVVMDLQPVIAYVEGLGVQRNKLPRVLMRYPDFLGFKLEGTISTSTAYLVGIGVNPRQIGSIITAFPEILGMRVGNNIKPKVDYLCSLGLQKEEVATILEKHPYILGGGMLDDKLRPYAQALFSIGVRKEAMPRIIMQFPDLFESELPKNLISKKKWLVEHVGVDSKDIPGMLEKLPQLVIVDEDKAIQRVAFLVDSAGFTPQQVAKMVTSCPQLLAIRIRETMIANLDYFFLEMGRPLVELVDFPEYFIYSLKNRIQPRYEEIKKKGIKCSLQWFLQCSDAVFTERLSLDYIERPLNITDVAKGASGNDHSGLEENGAFSFEDERNAIVTESEINSMPLAAQLDRRALDDETDSELSDDDEILFSDDDDDDGEVLNVQNTGAGL